MDVWVLDPASISQMNMACWVPIDHQPPPPERRGLLHQVRRDADRHVEVRAGDARPARSAVRARTASTRTPTSRMTAGRSVSRSALPEDAFLVGMVAANKGRPSRKGFSQAFQAFRKFAEKHDNAYLYLHTMVNPGMSQGENIPALLDALDIPQSTGC
jgi:hypothetical protein